jgi:dipeptidyl-peptidase 4
MNHNADMYRMTTFRIRQGFFRAAALLTILANFVCSAEIPDRIGHQTKVIEGWTLFHSDKLIEQNRDANTRALELLAIQLQEIARVVPAPAVHELRKVPLWFSPEYAGIEPRAEYHPGAGWLRDNGRNPEMEKAVEFTNIRVFEHETKRMPNFALHELAHAYHDRVLPKGFDNEAIQAAFLKAKEKGLYEQVEQRFGDGRSATVRAYAMSNPMEYFAECTEAYFSTNDFFPFNREQLQQHDPVMFALLGELWGQATVSPATGAQPTTPDASRLTLERIFSSDEFRGESVPTVKWLEKGEYTTLRPAKNDGGELNIVSVDNSGKQEILVASSMLVPSNADKPLKIEDYEFSKDLDVVLIFTNSVKVWRQNTRGDYWTFRRSTGKLTKLGGAAQPSALMFAKLSPDATQVAYVHENNLLIEPVEGGDTRMLTKDGSNDVINGTFDWVYEEEFSCRDGWRWSPDGQQIAFWQLDSTDVKKFSLVDYTTANYPILKTFAYPKTGEQNSACRIGVVPAAGGATRWIEVPGNTRMDYYIPRMEWAGNSLELAIQRVNRLQNAVDVMIADTVTGKVRTVMTERDGTWVDIHDDAMEWMDSGSAFTWISERQGWRQLYIVSRDGERTRRAATCDFDIIQVLHIDEKAGRVYFLASPENPTQQYLYSASLDGNAAPKQLTPITQPGTHDYALSPDGAFAVHTYSAFGKPPWTEFIALPEHTVLHTLSDNKVLREAVEKLNQTPVEFVRAEIADGVLLDGWLMKPAGFDENKKYPLIVHVYGEPAAQSVRDRWGGNHYLWHLMLTQQGYLVACFDNRGTPCPRGREWRKAAYRRVGTLASEDQAAAAREILKRPYLDAKRVGVWGWSGGGSMTLNLMFRYPDHFHTGIAVASVPDMRLYDTIYQERYMGLPQDNPGDYQHGSPITHAAGLKGNLLIVHGSGDDNCHAQGMEKLTNRLIELNKPFSQMSYPNRSHSINEGETTSLHLYGLMTRFLNHNLPSDSTQ